jgi:hypothetical protein
MVSAVAGRSIQGRPLRKFIGLLDAAGLTLSAFTPVSTAQAVDDPGATWDT